MKMKKKYKIGLIIIGTIIFFLAIFAVWKFVLKNESQEKPPITNITTVTNQIEGYNYTLEDRDSELFNELFKELKTNLESGNVNEEEYAKTIAKLFIVDLYTINNKISKYDIGGLEYLYEGATNSFRAKVLDSIYKTVEDNSYKTRTQELPEVNNIEIDDINKNTYQMENQTFASYEISLSWNYKKDFGYDKKGIVIAVKKENKLHIVSFQPLN